MRSVMVRNLTLFPSREVDELLSWVFADRPLPQRIDVRLYAPRYGDVYAMTSPNGRVVRISLPLEYPTDHHYPGLAGAPTYTTRDWREELVVDAAHEAVHVAGDNDELAAERAAFRALRAYRWEHPLRSIALWAGTASW